MDRYNLGLYITCCTIWAGGLARDAYGTRIAWVNAFAGLHVHVYPSMEISVAHVQKKVYNAIHIGREVGVRLAVGHV